MLPFHLITNKNIKTLFLQWLITPNCCLKFDKARYNATYEIEWILCDRPRGHRPYGRYEATIYMRFFFFSVSIQHRSCVGLLPPGLPQCPWRHLPTGHSRRLPHQRYSGLQHHLPITQHLNWYTNDHLHRKQLVGASTGVYHSLLPARTEAVRRL